MSPTTHALVDYWHELPSLSAAERRRALEATARTVRAGFRPASALLPAALGDPDGDVVRRATAHYVSSWAAASADGRLQAIDEAAEWIRRELALNRAAVFLALFDLDDPAADTRLAALRLVLPEADIDDPAADTRLAALRLVLPEADTAILWRELEANTNRRAREFLADWRALLCAAAEERAAA